MKKINISIYGLLLLLLASACTEDFFSTNNNRKIEVTAALPGSETRGSLDLADASLNLIANWNDNDEIQVFIKQGNKVYKSPMPSNVYDITDEGKKCTFGFELPQEVNLNEPYTIFGLCDLEGTISEGTLSADCQLRRKLCELPTSAFTPMWFMVEGGPQSVVANFRHIETYEVLHVKNDTPVGIMFRHRGFDTNRRWYRYNAEIPLPDDYAPNQSVLETNDVSSTAAFIGAGQTGHVLSCYVPTGEKINEAKLLATIDGQNVVSSNTLSSSVQIQRGHAYHMYATWDGTELKFDKVNDLLDELGLGFKRLEMEEDGSYGFATGREGHLSFATTDPSVATAVETDDIGDMHVDILSHSVGTAVITITDTNTGQKSQIEVVVSERIHFAVLVEVGETECVTMKNVNGNYEAYPEDASLVTCDVRGNKIFVTGVKSGETVIHVTETGTNKQYIISVKVYGGIPDIPVEDETFTVNGVTFKMIAVEGGSFMMGSPDDDPDADDEEAEGERPRHKVTLDSFSIGQTEVTQALWKAVMGSNPSDHQGSDYPVEKVSWDDCQEFIAKLNNLTGRTFRLPTEAEWEYAARGGKYSQGYKYAGSDDFEEVAWCYNNYNYNGYTHPVATKKPNELGLYDMSGNVFELCQDWYDEHYYQVSPQYNPMGPSSGTRRVSRGGMYRANQFYCRVTFRESENISRGSNHFGLRLVLSDGGVPQPTAYLTCPDENHPHLIDLGLPSGTLWACCNVGATTPEGYGDYFAWGETSPKDVYSWSTYIHCDGSESSCHDICEDIGGTNHDAAAVNWDEQWKMPSHAQIQELKDNCSSIWTSQNGVNGRRFIGKNNGTIFLPAASCRDGSDIGPIGTNGFYWSSSHCLNVNKDAWALGIYPDNASYPVDVYGDFRCFGLSVRPVKNSGNTSVSEGDEL